MSVSPDVSELSPGDEVELVVRMANDATEAIVPEVEVAGLGADMWRLAGPLPVIPPGQIAQTTLVITVPADTPPGDRRISVTVRSPLTKAAASAPAALRVGAGDVIAVEATPQAVSGRKGAGLTAVVHNRGSQDLDLRITGRSEGAEVRVKPAQVRLAAGQSTRVAARFSRRRRSWFRERKHGVVFDVRGHTLPATTTAMFIQRPVVPPVLLRALAVLVALSVWAASVFVVFTNLSATEESATDTGEVIDTGPQPPPPPVVLPDPDADPSAGADGQVAPPVVIQGSVEGPRDPAGTTVVIERVSFGDQGTTNGGGKIAASASPVALTSGAVLDKVRTVTDDRGRFRVASGLRAGAFYRVSALRAGFEVRSVVISTATSTEIDLALTMIPANGQMSGRVVDVAGTPLGGVTVEATQGLITYRTVTASSGENAGRWVLDALATPATYLITVRQNGFASQTLTVDLDGGQNLGGVDATLVPNQGTIRGQITYRDAGVGAITVRLEGEGISRETTSLTDGALAGNFSFPSLPYGVYLLTFVGDGWMTQSREVTVSTGDVPVAVRDLVPSTGIIQGIVAQETVAGGCGYPDTTGGAPAGLVAQPCGGVGVSVIGENGTWRTTTATADGSFRLSGIPAGEYTVRFERFGYLPEFYSVVVRPGDVLNVPANASYDAALAAALGGPDRPLSPLNVGQVQLRVRPAATLTQGTVEGFLRDATDLDTAFDAAGTGREAWEGVCRTAMATISFVLDSGQTVAPAGCQLTEGGGFTLTGVASGVQRVRIAVPRFDRADVVLRVNPEGITSVGIIALTPLASVALNVTGALDQAVNGAEVFIAPRPGTTGFLSDVATGVTACRVTNVSGMWQVTTAATTGAAFRDGVCATVGGDGSVALDRSLGSGSFDIIAPVNAADPVTASALATTVPLDHRQVVRAVEVRAGENVRLDLRLRRYGVILGSLAVSGARGLTALDLDPATLSAFPNFLDGLGVQFCEADATGSACVAFTDPLVQPRLSLGTAAGLPLGQYRIDRIPPNEGATLRNYRLIVDTGTGVFVRSGESAITGVNFGSELIVNGVTAPQPIDVGVKIVGVGDTTLSAFVRARGVTELDGARTPPEVFSNCPEDCVNNDFGRDASVDAGAQVTGIDPDDANKPYHATTIDATLRFLRVFRPIGEITFEVRAPGYLPRTVSLPTSSLILPVVSTEPPVSGQPTREIALTPEPRAVNGTVTVATGNIPSGLVASLTPCEGGAALSGPVNNGAFSFASVTPGNYRIAISGPGIFPTEVACPGADAALTVPLGTGAFTLDAVQLQVASQITVAVTEGGSALTSGGVSVRLTGGPSDTPSDNVILTRTVCTTADVSAGTCTTAGSVTFAEVKPGTYTAQTLGAGFVGGSTTITVAAGATGTATIAVQRYPQITGRVLAKVGADDVSGAPLAGADVHLTRDGAVVTNAAGTPLSVVTDAQGRFTFPHTLEIPTVSAGSSYVVSISAPGYDPQEINLAGPLALGDVVNLSVPSPSTLVNTPVTVAGTVSAAVPGGYIKISLLGTNSVVTTSTTSYSIQVPPRPGTLRFQEFDGNDQPTDRPIVERSVVGTPGQTLTVNVELTIAQGGMTGVIARADRSGAASQTLPAGVMVTLTPSSGGDVVTVSTRSDGSFVANPISTGTYTLTVSVPGYGTSTVVGIAVVANTTTTVPTLVMTAEARDTRFTITSSVAGSSLEGVTVSARSAGQADVVAVVAADGTVVLPALQPGVWTVTTAGAPALTQPHLNATEFTLTVPADTVSPAVEFAAPTRTLQRYALITGTVGFRNYDTNGFTAAILGTDATVSVTAAPAGSATTAAVVTTSASTFAIWVPVAGVWGVAITAEDHDPRTESVTVPVSGAGAVGSATAQNLAEVDLLPSARTVEVQVSSSVAGSTPDWAGLTLSLQPPVGSGLTALTGVRTGDTFRFTGVRPATWTIFTSGAPGLVTVGAVPRPHLDTVSAAAVPVGTAGVDVIHAVTLQRFGLITGTVAKGYAGGALPDNWPTFATSNGQVTVSASPAGLPAPVTLVSGTQFIVWVPTTSAVAGWTFGLTATHFESTSPAITVNNLNADVAVDVTMLPPPRDLVIPVVSAPAGADLTGLTVVVTSVVDNATVSASATVAGGQATFSGLVPGIWQVTTSGAPGRTVPHIDQEVATPRTLIPGIGAFTVPTALTLQRFGRITGTVTLGYAGGGATPTGWPTFGDNAGGTVTISAAPSPFTTPTPAVSAGGFTIWVPTVSAAAGADWEVGVAYPGFVTQVTTAAVPSLGTDVDVTVTLEPAPVDVTVSVTSSGGGELAGVTVSASSTVSGTPTTLTGVTSVTGEVTLTLTPGKWVVTTSGASESQTPHVDRTLTTAQVILPSTTTLALALDPFRIVSGTVFSVGDVDTDQRTTVSGATVTATSSAGTVTAVTGSDGTYSLTLDPTLDWTISVTAAGGDSSGTRELAAGTAAAANFDLEVVTAGRSVSGTLTGADGRKVVISYAANGYLAEQITLTPASPRTYSLSNLNRAATWTITFELYKADGVTIERSITRWVGPGNEDVVLNQDLAGAPAGNVRVRITDLGQAFDPGIRLAGLHTQVTLRDFDGLNCLGVVRTTSYNVAQTAGDTVVMDVVIPMPTGQFCVKVTPFAGSPAAGGVVTTAYADPVTISAVTPDNGSPVNVVTVTAADQSADATVMVTLRPRTRSVTFTDGSITNVTASAVVIGGFTYWPSQTLGSPSVSGASSTFSNVRPGRWFANGDAAKPFAVPIGEGGLTLSGTTFTADGDVASLAFLETDVTGSATGLLPRVRVELRDGEGIRTQNSTTIVTMSANCGDCLSGVLTATAVNGVATFDQLRIASAGSVVLTATSGVTSSTLSVTVTSTVLRFAQQPIGTSAGSTLLPVAVEVWDSVRNQRVTTTSLTNVTVAAAGLNGNTVRPVVDGVATFTNLSIANVGSYTLAATSGSLPTATSDQFEIVGADANVLTFTAQPGTTSAGTTLGVITVEARTSGGAVLSSFTGPVSIGFASTPTGAVLSGTTTVNAANGVATFTGLSIATAGEGYTLVASSTGLVSAVSSSFDITAAAAPVAARVAFVTQPATVAAGATLNEIRVEIQDAVGARVSSYTGQVTVTLNPSSGLSGTTTVTLVNGVATFTNLSIATAGTGYTLTATSGGLSGAPSEAFDVVTSEADVLVFTAQPTTTSAGALFVVSVAAQTAAGAVVSSFTGPVSIGFASNPAGAVLSGTTTVNAVDGVATFDNLSIATPGTGYTLVVTSPGRASAVSTAFAIE